MIRILSCLMVALLSIAPVSNATNQQPDLILIDGAVVELCVTPILAPYFDEAPDRLPKTQFLSSALWRGYVATFAIVDGFLMVHDVEVVESADLFDGETWRSVLEQVMPNSDDRRLDWFSGSLHYLEIRNLDGGSTGSLEYFHRRITIENGKATENKVLSSEIHVKSSGLACSAGWEVEANSEPMINEWCHTDSIVSSDCTEEIDIGEYQAWLYPADACPLDVLSDQPKELEEPSVSCQLSFANCWETCRHGFAADCFWLANHAESTEEIQSHATALYLKSCELGIHPGCTNTAARISSRRLHDEVTAETLDCANATIEVLCERDDPWACTTLGYRLIQGYGFEVDYARALQVLRKACADDSDSRACTAAQKQIVEIERILKEIEESRSAT